MSTLSDNTPVGPPFHNPFNMITVAEVKHFYPHDKERLEEAKKRECCKNEKRNMNGGCDNCDDPSL